MERKTDLSFERSARRDPRFWMLFLVGAIFVWGASSIDPAQNCSESGECAPILVPIAWLAGLVATMSGAAWLIVNPRCGSRIDPATGRLEWWQNRVGAHDGDTGSIAPADIAQLRIVLDSDGPNEVHLYDLAGERQHFFDVEVIPWRIERWANRLTERYPHIKIEVVDQPIPRGVPPSTPRAR